MEDIEFWVDGFCLLEIQSNCKNWVWKEKAVELSMYSHGQIYKISILKMWKIKNVFTLGPTAQATLGLNLTNSMKNIVKYC